MTRAPFYFSLRTRVRFRPAGRFELAGEIRGVSHQAEPRYDILAESGEWFSNVPACQVEEEKEAA